MKILITGGAGFIASHVANAYLDAGHEVVIVDNLATGFMHNVDTRARFYNLDICDSALDQVFKDEQPDIVNHHAAQVSVPLSIANPEYDAKVNVMGLLNVLNCSVKHNVQKVIFISSGGAIYGEANQVPTGETYPPVPLSVYAINKMMGESYVRYFNHQFGIRFSILRYANVYGPRQVSHGEAGVVALFISQLLDGQTPTICRYPDQPNGMIRDYVFVSDVVRANLIALDSGDNDVFNIGTCTPTATMDLFKAIKESIMSDCVPYLGDARPGDIRNSLLDISKAKQFLDWEPKVNLCEGIGEVVAYFKQKKTREKQ
jgi:UDP-glucose 4-epimerase